MNEGANVHEIIPAFLAVRAMRDNGYKGTEHAIAELIDNSVQAGANIVRLVCAEKFEVVQQRRRTRVYKIAVIDDGKGMDEATLRKALQFGNGNYLDDRSGIGRFGMGLPTSSFSQCRRVDVWSWQSGPDNAIHSYLSLSEIEERTLTIVPAPQPQPVPEEWRKAWGTGLSQRGTVVVWSELDRVKWSSAEATLRNSEFLLGRIYRKKISQDGLIIRMSAWSIDDDKESFTLDARANDPMYLMTNTSTPRPYDVNPMFQSYGEGSEVIDAKIGDVIHRIVIRTSYAKDEARTGGNGGVAGAQDYGKHASKNVGVSLVRAGRELVLDETLVNADPTERWWGVEIDFPAELDELFGVTNNKQDATAFRSVCSQLKDDKRDDDWNVLKEEWENDTRLILFEVVNRVRTLIRELRRLTTKQTIGSGTRRERHEGVTPEKIATRETIRRIEQLVQDGRDTAELVDEADDERAIIDGLTSVLTSEGMSPATIQDDIEVVIRQNLRFFTLRTDQESDAFFIPKASTGMHINQLNVNHPLFDKLFKAFEPEENIEDVTKLQEIIKKTSDVIQLLLLSWVRYELEERAGERREQVALVRKEWGKMAKLFLADLS